MDKPKLHLIIVDDDADSRDLIRRVIVKVVPGARISEAGDGEQALSLFETAGADLMVVDHKLPRMSGTELIQELRARRAAIPLAMLSNHPGAREEAMKAGATFFADKGALRSSFEYYLPALLPSE
jgi:DNA-binding response OmpR family regulator